jgi:hypothetical protein
MFRRIYLGAILCGASLGLLGAEVQSLHREVQAIPKLEKRGFVFLYANAPTVPQWLQDQLGERYQQRAVVAWCNNPLATNHDLRLLRNLPYLTCLSLSGTHVSNRACRHLRELANLRYLNLHGTKVTKWGFAQIGSCLPECEFAWEPSTVSKAIVNRWLWFES